MKIFQYIIAMILASCAWAFTASAQQLLHPQDEMRICWVVDAFLNAERRNDHEAIRYLVDPRVTGFKRPSEEAQIEVMKGLSSETHKLKVACHIGVIKDITAGVYVKAEISDPSGVRSPETVSLYVIKRGETWFVAIAEPTELRELFLRALIKCERSD